MKCPPLVKIVNCGKIGVGNLRVKVKIEGEFCEAVVDTGASDTIISPLVLDQSVGGWDKIDRLAGHSLQLATGATTPIMGRGVVRMELGSLEVDAVVWVAEVCDRCLLGLSFLVEHDCQLDLGRGHMWLGTEKLRLEGLGEVEEAQGARLEMSRTVTVPPRSETVVLAGISARTNHVGQLGMVEPWSSGKTAGLMVGRTLVDTHQPMVMVRLLNLSDSPHTVRGGAVIAKCSSVVEITRGDGTTDLPVQPESGQNFGKTNWPEGVRDMVNRAEQGLTVDQVRSLHNLVGANVDVFSLSPEDFGRTSLVRHQIDTGEARPVRQPARRLPLAKRDEAEKQVEKMKEAGIIEPSVSPWVSPIVLVRKKDGTIRFCVDYRQLNQVTLKDSYPLPRIDDTLDAISGSKWFTTLDLKSGYWQVEMDKQEREKTAFSTGKGLWQFVVMPFGLCNAPATFERLMERVLIGLPWQTCLIYLDDVLVHAPTFEQAAKNLVEVFRRLRGAGLKLNPGKCEIFRKEVVYLGHVVNENGVATDPMKAVAVKEWPTPSNVREVRGFLGLCSYYRKFVANFASIARPLHQLTEKGAKFVWSENCTKAFNHLKQRLIEAPVLAYPAETGQFILDTDASQGGLGAVLSQVQQGVERVIAYYSRALSKPERNYCVTRKELLALLSAVGHFHPYLYGREFVIRVDHASLQWLLRFKEPEGQIARWLEKLQQYNFVVQHRPGKTHANADALSRRPCWQHQCKFCERQENRDLIGQEQIDACLCAARVTRRTLPQPPPEFGIVDWKKEQKEDPVLGHLCNWLEGGKRPAWEEIASLGAQVKAYWAQWQMLQLKDGILYREWELPTSRNASWLLVVPSKLREQVMGLVHGTRTMGHLGVTKTLAKLRQRFYWVNSGSDIQKWVRWCDLCRGKKTPPCARKAPLQIYNVGAPLERVAVDVVGPLPTTHRGNKYILVAMDYFTRWPEAYALPNQEARLVAQALVEGFFTRFGTPRELHTDQGRNFESELLRSVCELLQIYKTRTTPLRPQSDGMVERFNKTLLTQLALFTSQNQQDWDEHLPFVLMAYRTAQHEATRCTPALLMFGREMRVPVDLWLGVTPETPTWTSAEGYATNMRKSIEKAHDFARERIGLASSRAKLRYDSRTHTPRFLPGDLIWLFRPQRKKGVCPKLTSPWKGPGVMLRQVTDVVFKIQMGHHALPQIVHCDRLSSYMGRDIPDWIERVRGRLLTSVQELGPGQPPAPSAGGESL